MWYDLDDRAQRRNSRARDEREIEKLEPSAHVLGPGGTLYTSPNSKCVVRRLGEIACDAWAASWRARSPSTIAPTGPPSCAPSSASAFFASPAS